MLITVLLIAQIIGFIYLYVHIYIIKRKQSDIIKQQSDRKSNEISARDQEKYIYRLRNEYEMLYDKIQKLDHKIECIVKNQISENSKVILGNNKTEQETYQMIYLPFPDREGFFWQKDLLEQINHNISAYVMKLDKRDNKLATFKFLYDSKKVMPAIAGYDIYLEPVCELIELTKQGSKIEQVGDDGELILEGNKWRVNPVKKLKIKIV